MEKDGKTYIFNQNSKFLVHIIFFDKKHIFYEKHCF